MLRRIENAPLTERVKAQILDGIMSKEFDTRLPSEDDLAEILQVSRTTVRTSLQSLEQDGIITRKRAIGTTINAHVRPSSLALQRMVGFDSLLREKGYEVDVQVRWRHQPLGEDIAAKFDLDPGQDSLVTEKSYLANGALAISIRDAVAWENLSNPRFRGRIRPSIFEFSTQHWKRPIDHVVVEMVPKVKGEEDPTPLPMAEGQPYMQLLERLYDAAGELLAVSLVDVDSSYVHFEIFRRR